MFPASMNPRGGPAASPASPPPPPQVHVVKFQTTPSAGGNDGFAGIIGAIQKADKTAADAAARRAAEVARLDKLYGSFGGALEKAEKRNRALMKDMASGAVVRRIQRRAEAVAKYGERWGNVVAKYGPVVTKVGDTAAAGVTRAAAAGNGLARQGFQGTVEQARYDTEMKLLSRELAATLKPVMELMTRGARTIRRYLEGLSDSGQNAVGTGLLAGGGLAGLWAARTAVTGGLASRLLGGAATAAGSGAASAGASAGAAAVGGAASGYGRLALRAAPVLLPVAAVAAATQSDDYTRLRREGASKFKSVVGAGIGGAYDLGHGLFAGRDTPNALDAERKRQDDIAARRGLAPGEVSPGDHRRVTLAGGGFEETTGLYDRLQSSIESVDPGKDMRELREAMETLTTAIRESGPGRRSESPPLRDRG